MMKYSALIGKPTEHSVSHIMYEELARAAGIKVDYKHLKIDVELNEISETISAFRALRFVGVNVTLPYKMEVIKHVDTIDDTVKLVGAVNTISFKNKITGYNTDWMGIFVPIHNQICKKTIQTVVIFGSGGAARAAIYAAVQLKAKQIIVLYRSLHDDVGDLKMKAAKIGFKLLDYTHVQEAVTNADVVINATSAGMVGKDLYPFDLSLLDDIKLQGKVFLDAVFNPVQTPLMQYFNSRYAITIDGLWMMLYQGISALSIWLDQDIEIPEDDLERIHTILKEAIEHV